MHATCTRRRSRTMAQHNVPIAQHSSPRPAGSAAQQTSKQTGATDAATKMCEIRRRKSSLAPSLKLSGCALPPGGTSRCVCLNNPHSLSCRSLLRPGGHRALPQPFARSPRSNSSIRVQHTDFVIHFCQLCDSCMLDTPVATRHRLRQRSAADETSRFKETAWQVSCCV